MSCDGYGMMVTVQAKAGEGGMSSRFERARAGIPVRPSTIKRFDHYEAHPGQTEEWVIAPPEEMIRVVEKRLKTEAAEKVTGKKGD